MEILEVCIAFALLPQCFHGVQYFVPGRHADFISIKYGIKANRTAR